MAALEDSSAVLYCHFHPNTLNLPVLSYHSQSSYLISRAFYWHDNGQSFNKEVWWWQSPSSIFLRLTRPSLSPSLSLPPSVSSVALRAVGLTNFSIPTPAASLSKLCLWIPHQTEPHYKEPYHSSFKCLTAKAKIRSGGVLVLKGVYWSRALMVDITMALEQEKKNW